jgi:hypothetical protein
MGVGVGEEFNTVYRLLSLLNEKKKGNWLRKGFAD